jgi:UDP-N-acetylglucosamine 4,6-dehydratase
MKNLARHDIVLITGGTGSLGRALIPQVLACGVEELRVLSRDEVKQAELQAQYPGVRYILGDVRDLRACKEAVRGASVVIHAASLKYVDVSELQPTEYALTNVFGTINMIQAVTQDGGVNRMIGISTDKMVNPINTYGLTKGLLEKFFVESHTQRKTGFFRAATNFVVCRYGNVVATRGSVILKWSEALRKKEPLLITDPTMTRFFFTLNEAVDLIDLALGESSGTIVSKAMPSTTLGELADTMAGPEGIRVVGRRPGEKAHEDLLSTHEMPRVIRRGNFFYYKPLDPPAKHFDAAYTSFTARRLSSSELLALTAPWR